MPHQRFEEVVLPHLDNELTRGESVEIVRHLETCAMCRHRLGEHESLGRLVRSAPYYTAPDRLRAAVGGATMRAPSRFTPLALHTVIVSSGVHISFDGEGR